MATKQFNVQCASTGPLVSVRRESLPTGSVTYTDIRTDNGSLVIDGYTMQVGDLVLLKNEVRANFNGIYSMKQQYPFKLSSKFKMSSLPEAKVSIVNGKKNASKEFKLIRKVRSKGHIYFEEIVHDKQNVETDKEYDREDDTEFSMEGPVVAQKSVIEEKKKKSRTIDHKSSKKNIDYQRFNQHDFVTKNSDIIATMNDRLDKLEMAVDKVQKKYYLQLEDLESRIEEMDDRLNHASIIL